MSSSSMPNARTCSALVETATKCAPTASSPSRSTSQERAAPALARVSAGGERLRADDEQRLRGVEAGQRRLEVGAVDVGDEARVERAVEAAAQGAHDHARPEVGAADPDVHHGREALTVDPVRSPERTLRANASMRPRTSWTSAVTSWPSTRAVRRPAGAARCAARRGPRWC
jgi:hypothetical protein